MQLAGDFLAGSRGAALWSTISSLPPGFSMRLSDSMKPSLSICGQFSFSSIQ
jgi:hypothetical protein